MTKSKIKVAGQSEQAADGEDPNSAPGVPRHDPVSGQRAFFLGRLQINRSRMPPKAGWSDLGAEG